MEIVLDFSKISNKDEMFELIKSQLNNEEFYGNNLDALYDVLSYEKQDVKFVISNIKNLEQEFKLYIKKFVLVVEDVEQINNNVKITIL